MAKKQMKKGKQPVVGNGGGQDGSRSLMPKTWDEVINAALKLGVPSVIALGAFYWLTTNVSAKLDAHMTTTHEMVEQIKSSSQTSWQLVAISQRICLNTAKTDADRMSCVVTPPPPNGDGK